MTRLIRSPRRCASRATVATRCRAPGGLEVDRASSNLVGFCTGRSAAFAPLSMRSTSNAVRRQMSAPFGPMGVDPAFRVEVTVKDDCQTSRASSMMRARYVGVEDTALATKPSMKARESVSNAIDLGKVAHFNYRQLNLGRTRPEFRSLPSSGIEDEAFVGTRIVPPRLGLENKLLRAAPDHFALVESFEAVDEARSCCRRVAQSCAMKPGPRGRRPARTRLAVIGSAAARLLRSLLHCAHDNFRRSADQFSSVVARELRLVAGRKSRCRCCGFRSIRSRAIPAESRDAKARLQESFLLPSPSILRPIRRSPPPAARAPRSATTQLRRQRVMDSRRLIDAPEAQDHHRTRSASVWKGPICRFGHKRTCAAQKRMSAFTPESRRSDIAPHSTA